MTGEKVEPHLQRLVGKCGRRDRAERRPEAFVAATGPLLQRRVPDSRAVRQLDRRRLDGASSCAAGLAAWGDLCGGGGRPLRRAPQARSAGACTSPSAQIWGQSSAGEATCSSSPRARRAWGEGGRGGGAVSGGPGRGPGRQRDTEAVGSVRLASRLHLGASRSALSQPTTPERSRKSERDASPSLMRAAASEDLIRLHAGEETRSARHRLGRPPPAPAAPDAALADRSAAERLAARVQPEQPVAVHVEAAAADARLSSEADRAARPVGQVELDDVRLREGVGQAQARVGGKQGEGRPQLARRRPVEHRGDGEALLRLVQQQEQRLVQELRLERVGVGACRQGGEGRIRDGRGKGRPTGKPLGARGASVHLARCRARGRRALRRRRPPPGPAPRGRVVAPSAAAPGDRGRRGGRVEPRLSEIGLRRVRRAAAVRIAPTRRACGPAGRDGSVVRGGGRVW